MSENKVKYAFASVSPYIQTNKVENTEKKISGKDFISWGMDNKYPNYLYGLYENTATLQSVINGTADFILGNEVSVYDGRTTVNNNGDTIEDVLRKVAVDYLIFGSFALQIIRNVFGKISEVYWVDIRKLRSDEKNEVFFFSEDWDKSVGRVKTIKYPKFNALDETPTSIFYYKSDISRGTYSTPLYSGAITECEISKRISDFHLNEISNNFLTSKVVNFNNGVPEEDMQDEIERKINEKFSGSENGGRIMIAFNDNKDNAVTVENLGEDGFADRYSALSKRVESQIFTAFRCTPVIFGLPQEGDGFNVNEYNESFKLYNRTTVKPIQKRIVDVFDKIYGVKGSINIVPFTLSGENETMVE